MIDLHMHSSFSDGSFTPEELVNKAVELNVSAISLTDHDTMAGVPRFLEAGARQNLQVIAGVEISTDYKGRGMHILGYGMNIANPELQQSLDWIRAGREARNMEILEKLNRLGFIMTWEEVVSRAGEDVVGRPHFAQTLIDKGYVKDKYEAFDKWLGHGKPGYADRRRLDPEAGIRIIRKAGGVAVLAHPFTLNLSNTGLRSLLLELSRAGLEGIEAYYAEHKPDMQDLYLKMAAEYDLLVTGGTDFHGSLTPMLRIGFGFGSLNVPDSLLEPLLARISSRAG
ncbi:MAG TPA: PHP domain-containing protein [Kiritimatiellia bacterium]|nr:PHP domain-containing protein [Kiritimatiellia bacterium]HQQ03475.1 PHP domain-containing protein [Kiritimatiellia bacterium]